MSVNEGALDRTARIVIGLLLIGAALGLYGPNTETAWGWIGIVPLITGAVGTCPIYSLLGINTCRR